MGWEVTVVDPSEEALARMEGIYTTRYGAWDPAIVRAKLGEEKQGGFDVILLGTPPHVRIDLARKALAEKPKVLQLEKPLTTPLLEGLDAFLSEYASQSETIGIVGYDHALAESVVAARDIVSSGVLGTIETVDVNFREHWKGIFAAHPWLSGPKDSYLGYWKKGGGAGNEHSHALHLWYNLASASPDFGNPKTANVSFDMRRDGEVEYDAVFALVAETDKGKIGRVDQDVLTLPVRKRAYIQGTDGALEVLVNGSPEGDIVRTFKADGTVEEKLFPKKRPDDFYREMLHIDDLIAGRATKEASPISLESGVRVARTLASAYKAPGRIELPGA